MTQINVRDLLEEARQAEKEGNKREASGKYGSLGVYLRKKKKLNESILFLRRAVQLSRTSPRLYVQLALSLAENGDNIGAKNAMEEFTKYALRREDSGEYRTYMENILCQFPELRSVYYEKLILLDKTNAIPFLLYAKACIEMGKHNEAKTLLIDALKTKTHTESVLKELKSILEKEGEIQLIEAIERFMAKKLSLEDLVIIVSNRPIQDFEKKSSPILEELPSMIKNLEEKLGLTSKEKQDELVPLILEFRSRSNEVIASDTKTRLDLALAFFEMGLLKDAKEEIYKIEPMDQHFHEAELILVDILLEEQSYLAALEIVQKCLRDEKMASDLIIEANYKLIKIYYLLGDIKNALDIATKLEMRNPNYRDVKELIQKLRSLTSNN